MGLTVTDRLQIIIDFARMDLDRLRPGDWLNLREDLTAFVLGEYAHGRWSDGDALRHRGQDTKGLVVSYIEGPWPHEMTAEALKDLQRDVRMALTERGTIQGPGGVFEQVHLFATWPQVKLASFGSGFAEIQATARDGVLFVLALLLYALPANALRSCPECGTPFVRVRKQQYCSRRCTNRANMRTWRQSGNGHGQESDRNHQRYQARVKRNSPKAKVARRPRSSKADRGRGIDGESETTGES